MLYRTSFFTQILCVGTCLLALGCATEYGPKSGWSNGYSETQLGSDLWEVRFEGSGLEELERVEDFSLLRAAELCLLDGYPFFMVLGEDVSVHRLESEEPIYRGEDDNEEVIGYRTSVDHEPTGHKRVQCGSSPKALAEQAPAPAKGKAPLILESGFVVSSIKRKYDL